MEYIIKSFNDYIEILRSYKSKHSEEIWYRGQNNSDWKLEPNIYRNKKPDIEPNAISTLRYKTPDFMKEYKEFKEKIKKDNLFNIENLNDFQILFLGQHYGLLTPVLDWTIDPLVALFFALDGYIYNKQTYPVIYLLKPGLCNRYCGKVWANNKFITEPICIDGKELGGYFEQWIKELEEPVSPAPIALTTKMEYSFRISRQSGNFTLHSAIQPLSYEWYNTTIQEEKFADKILIQPDSVEQMKESLSVLNINKDTIYKMDSDKLDDECSRIKKQAQELFGNTLNS